MGGAVDLIGDVFGDDMGADVRCVAGEWVCTATRQDAYFWHYLPPTP